MKIELGLALYFKQELGWLDASLSSILDKTNNDINTTLYLSKFTDELFEGCSKLAEKYEINFEPRGDNSPIHYYDETKHRAFDINKVDCAMILQPDVVFLKKDTFDSVMDEASQHFDSKYQINVSTDHPDDTLPLAIQIFTKKMWEKIGCGDINYYPAAGSEVDEYRRCYLTNGFDLEDTETYQRSLDGIFPPPWTHRIRHEHLMHIGRFRGGNIEQPKDSTLFKTRVVDYGLYVFAECVAHNSWVDYHLEKWGGHPRFESFSHPFNNPDNSIKIEWEQSPNPYPESKFVSMRGLVL